MSHSSTHPKEFVGCTCGADADTWEKDRRLPQVGQTYFCTDCGREVYVYNAGGRGESIRQWRPVTRSLATNLLFFDAVGAWPDSVLDDLFKQGLERMEAIDYYMADVEGLTQTEWASRRKASQQAVSENVTKARGKLAD